MWSSRAAWRTAHGSTRLTPMRPSASSRSGRACSARRQPRPRAGNAGTPAPSVTAATAGTGQFKFFVEQRSMIVREDGASVTGMWQPAEAVGEPAWTLVLQHASGSLEAAVDEARRRNLALSFGILAVLAVGTGLVAINAQRAERLVGPADAVCRHRVARAAHAARRDPVGRAEPVGRRGAGSGAGQALRRADRRRRQAAHRHGRAGAGIRGPGGTPAAGGRAPDRHRGAHQGRGRLVRRALPRIARRAPPRDRRQHAARRRGRGRDAPGAAEPGGERRQVRRVGRLGAARGGARRAGAAACRSR